MAPNKWASEGSKEDTMFGSGGMDWDLSKLRLYFEAGGLQWVVLV